MPVPDSDPWSDRLRRTLTRFDEALLRQVAGRLIKPRNQWPVAELIERILATVGNPAVIDRRLKELEPASRQVLACIGHSRQPRWDLGNLVELVISLGHPDGLKPVLDLLEAGLLYPDAGPEADGKAANPRIKSFEQWLAFPGGGGLPVFAHPGVAVRAVGEDLNLPDLSHSDEDHAEDNSSRLRALRSTPEADGLEWPLRLAVLWQQIASAPLRRTQQGGFFKRDAERLGQDPLLNAPSPDAQAELPDPGFLAAALAELEGVVEEAEGEVRVGTIPAAWDEGLAATTEALYADLPRLRTWNPRDGWRGGEAVVGNPFPGAGLLALLLLGRLPGESWARPTDLEEWMTAHHPYWTGEDVRPSLRKPWVATFLLGLAYPLRLVQAMREPDGEQLVRLTPTGRWLLGLAEAPTPPPVFPQTLLVQPNLEIVAYRQGLTPGLIGRLTRFADWKNLGPACTLQLGPGSVYRALESGQTFETIRLTLEQHGTRAIPPAVLDSLRTWADKRERITVYPSATLLEFASADDLSAALARGLPGERLADRLAVVIQEGAIDFRHFRLTGSRDYGLPPEQCVTVEPDGVTLTVDLARSDLLMETELPRFAELIGRPGNDGRRQYRLTPASLTAARASGFGLATLEAWFQQRSGQPLSPAARLLLTGADLQAPRLLHHLVLHVPSEELADGLMQWPPTRELIEARLGPTALTIAEDKVAALREQLRALGIAVTESESARA
jgi:hypothetical protein